MGLFQRFAEIFSGGNDPERKKKRILKEIGKQLGKQKFKFYKTKGKEILPGLPRFFFNMYKVLGAAQALLENAKSSGALKIIIIESALTDKQRDLLEEFSEETIRQRAEKEDVKEIASKIKEEIVTFFSYFDNQRIGEINRQYDLFLIFMQIINFDYYFMLKKFDANLQENNFTYNPDFENLSGEYILDDLKDFLEILPLLDPDDNWEGLFDILKIFKGTDIIARNDWKKLIRVLVNIRNSESILLLVRHIMDDPYYKVTSLAPKEHIVEDYLHKMKTQTELTLQKIVQGKRNSKIENLAKVIFNSPVVARTKNYTEKGNILFSKKMLSGYIHIAPLNYLKAFLLDFVKKDIKEIVDLFLIKAQWATNIVSQQLSESFHHLIQISDDLIKLDDSLAEEAELGVKLKSLVSKADKDQNSLSVLKQLLKEINEKAARMIKEAGQSLIGLAKNLKSLLDEYSRHGKETVVNWKELDIAAENKIKEKLTIIYKQIYYFIQLIQMFFK